MTELATSPEQALREHMREKRTCIAYLMDAHPEFFARPTVHDCWSDFAVNLPEQDPEAADQAPQMDPQDQDTIQQAIVRVGMVIRSAQDRSEPDFNMDELLDQVEADGIAQLDADPRVLEIASPEASAEEVRTLARAMSLYKEAVRNDVANGNELRDTISGTFDELPAETPFMRTLVDTARQLVLLDLEYAMRQA